MFLSFCLSFSLCLPFAIYLQSYLSSHLPIYLSIHVSIDRMVYSQNPPVLVTFQWMHNPLHLPHKTTSERPKCLRDPSVFNTFDFEMCFARATTPCTFSTSQLPKSAPRPPVFNTFYFQMCFAPQRRTLFRHLNVQKCSETDSF